MTKGPQTQGSVCYSDELSREKSGSEVKQPWFPPFGRGEEDAEGVSRTKVREFIGCGYRATNHRYQNYRNEDLADRTHR